MQALYTITATEEFINKLYALNYTCVQLNEGGVGIGDWICLSNDSKRYNFIITEVYLNEWSSAQKIRAQAKLSKKNQKALADLGYAY